MLCYKNFCKKLKWVVIALYFPFVLAETYSPERFRGLSDETKEVLLSQQVKSFFLTEAGDMYQMLSFSKGNPSRDSWGIYIRTVYLKLAKVFDSEKDIKRSNLCFIVPEQKILHIQSRDYGQSYFFTYTLEWLNDQEINELGETAPATPAAPPVFYHIEWKSGERIDYMGLELHKLFDFQNVGSCDYFDSEKDKARGN